MSDWMPLRAYLGQFVDDQTGAEPDRKARAVLAWHRYRIVDQIELMVLRQAFAEPVPEQQVVAINGHRMNGKRLVKVGARR